MAFEGNCELFPHDVDTNRVNGNQLRGKKKKNRRKARGNFNTLYLKQPHDGLV